LLFSKKLQQPFTSTVKAQNKLRVETSKAMLAYKASTFMKLLLETPVSPNPSFNVALTALLPSLIQTKGLLGSCKYPLNLHLLECRRKEVCH
jgi:hypothetical protein